MYSLAVQADGKILVGGYFTTLGGQTRNYIGRLNADGTLDTTFNPGASFSVYSLAVQADGKILVGGASRPGRAARNYLGRLNNTEPATQSLSFDGSTITWLRGGTSPEVWRTTFDASTNGTDWISLRRRRTDHRRLAADGAFAACQRNDPRAGLLHRRGLQWFELVCGDGAGPGGR